MTNSLDKLYSAFRKKDLIKYYLLIMSKCIQILIIFDRMIPKTMHTHIQNTAHLNSCYEK